MSPLPSGIRRASRRLARSPGFTFAAVIMLAVGIGASTTIFSIARGILLRPLPYHEADRLLRAHHASPERDISQSPLSLPDLEDLRSQSTGVSHLAGYFSFERNLTREHEPAVLRATYVTADFFTALGPDAQVGRTLAPADFEQGLPMVVLSDRAWREHFGRDVSVLGSSVNIDGLPYTVVGVMPPSFRFPDRGTDLWLPVSLLVNAQLVPTNRSARWLAAVGRLADGWTTERAGAELGTIAGRLAEEHPASNRGWDQVTLTGLRESIVGDVRTALLLTLAAVGLVLVMVCTNLAGLLLVRATARHHDLVVRAALGAGRARLVREEFAEGLLLALLGGGGGLLLSIFAARAIRLVEGPLLPRTDAIEVDLLVVAFAFCITLLASALAGVLPAWRAASPDLASSLRSGSRGGTGRAGEWLRSGLVVAQIGLAVVLTVASGLMLRNLQETRRIDPGFEPSGVVTARIQIPIPADRSLLRPRILDRAERILDELRTLPGVEAAGSINTLPLRPKGTPLPLAAGAERPPGDAPLLAQPRSVAGDYFRAMRIPVLLGESFPAQAAEGAPMAAIISESTARRLWPGENPVGRSLWMGVPYRVIGVVGDVRGELLFEDPPLTVYRDLRQQPLVDVTFVVRTAAEPRDFTAAVRAAVARVDPAQPVTDVRPLADVVSASLGEDTLFTGLLGAFGVMALLVAMLGLYATLAFAVAQRSREIGIRMALGAAPGDVVRMVVLRGTGLASAGIIAGLLAASVTSRAVADLLHQVSPLDPLTFAGISVLLMATSLLATLVPARRATRADPLDALRTE